MNINIGGVLALFSKMIEKRPSEEARAQKNVGVSESRQILVQDSSGDVCLMPAPTAESDTVYADEQSGSRDAEAEDNVVGDANLPESEHMSEAAQNVPTPGNKTHMQTPNNLGVHKSGTDTSFVIQELILPDGDLLVVDLEIPLNEEAIVGTGDRMWYLAMVIADSISMRELRPNESMGTTKNANDMKGGECCRDRKNVRHQDFEGAGNSRPKLCPRTKRPCSYFDRELNRKMDHI